MTREPERAGAVIEKIIATIGDREFDARYPNRTHFVDAGHPDQSLLTSRALFSGDPAVVVYPDGQEVLFTPEQTRGVTAFLLALVVLWIKLREHSGGGELVQLPPRTRVQVRDASGLPRAA
jgi:hypothetical protein